MSFFKKYLDFVVDLALSGLKRSEPTRKSIYLVLGRYTSKFNVYIERIMGSGNSAVIWLVVAFLILIGLWAAFSKVDQVARGAGTVISSQRVQVIQSVDGGVLGSLPVREGDRVKSGQELASLDETRTRASLVETMAKRAGIAATIARIQAELSTSSINFPQEVLRFPNLMRAQEDLMRGRLRTIESDLKSLTDVAQYAQDELRMTEQLFKAGDASRVEVLRAQKQHVDAQRQLSSRKNQYLQDLNSELSKQKDEYEQIDQQVKQKEQQLRNLRFLAPMAGVVKNVRFTTLGAVLRPGDELMTIVPLDDELIIEARVMPKDISLIRVGQKAFIKFDAYDFSIYGGVDGEVVYVSPDSIRDDSQKADSPTATYYRVHVKTSSPVKSVIGKRLDVISGMTAIVDIRSDTRTVLQYLIKPITKTMSEAFTEK